MPVGMANNTGATPSRHSAGMFSPTALNFAMASAGELAGTIGALPAIIGAISDALGVSHIDMPATPEKVWRAANA